MRSLAKLSRSNTPGPHEFDRMLVWNLLALSLLVLLLVLYKSS